VGFVSFFAAIFANFLALTFVTALTGMIRSSTKFSRPPPRWIVSGRHISSGRVAPIVVQEWAKRAPCDLDSGTVS